jgi:PAS domain S-box-containing protein
MYHCRDKKMKNEEKKGDQLALNALQDERKLIEEELKISKEKYQTILESIEEAYFELDLSGNVTFLNKSAAKMLGYTLEEMIGKNYRVYIPQQQRKRVTKIFNKIYRTGIPATVYDYQVIKKDGNKIFRETSATLMQDSSDKAIGFRCVARDVTNRKLIEEALKKKDAELEIKSRSLAEINIALKVLLKQMEEEKLELERTVLSNIREIVMPYIEKLKTSRLTDNQIIFVETINNNLINITSPFLRSLTLRHFNLTTKEVQVAVLVKEGRTTKEITNVLNISAGAVDFHRNSIRKKLGLNNKKINLRSHLLSL